MGVPKRTPICVRSTRHPRYRFQIIVPAELNEGVRERKSFVTRKEAQSFASDLQVRKENFGTRLLQMPGSLRQEAEQFLPAKRLAGRSERYLSDLRMICGNFARTFGARWICDITPEDVEEWVSIESYSPTTRNKYWNIAPAEAATAFTS